LRETGLVGGRNFHLNSFTLRLVLTFWRSSSEKSTLQWFAYSLVRSTLRFMFLRALSRWQLPLFCGKLLISFQVQNSSLAWVS